MLRISFSSADYGIAIHVIYNARGAIMQMMFFRFMCGLLAVLFPVAAFAQAGAPAPAQVMQPPTLMGALFEMFPMFMIVFFIFYFMVLKPQQTKIRAQQELLSGLKRGDSVVTTGGIIGRVAGSEKEYILLEVSPNVKIKVEAVHVIKKQETKTVAAESAA